MFHSLSIEYHNQTNQNTETRIYANFTRIKLPCFIKSIEMITL